MPHITSSELPCNACEVSKSHKLPFVPRTTYSITHLHIILFDVWVAPI